MPWLEEMSAAAFFRLVPALGRGQKSLARVDPDRRVPDSALGPHRLARPRTPPFHGENRGSNPRGDASEAGAATVRTPEGFVEVRDRNRRCAASVAQRCRPQGGTNPRSSRRSSYVGGWGRQPSPSDSEGYSSRHSRQGRRRQTAWPASPTQTKGRIFAGRWRRRSRRAQQSLAQLHGPRADCPAWSPPGAICFAFGGILFQDA